VGKRGSGPGVPGRTLAFFEEALAAPMEGRDRVIRYFHERMGPAVSFTLDREDAMTVGPRLVVAGTARQGVRTRDGRTVASTAPIFTVVGR